MKSAIRTLVSISGVVLLVVTALAQAASDNVAPNAPAPAAESADIATLRQQLAAQKAINEQLRARVETLERQLAAARPSESIVLGLDADAPKPPVESDSANTAIEEALVSKGLVLLPVGDVRLTPRLTWSHDGSGDERYQSIISALSLEVGLPGGLATALHLPYVWRDYPEGRNDGAGDLALSLSKKLTRETERWPSFVLRLDYTQDSGGDAFEPVPIGNGVQSLGVTLSAVKRIEPLALYGHLSYTQAWSDSFIEPGDLYGVGFGVSLAATPEISLDAGLSFDFIAGDDFERPDADAYRTDFATAGYLELGADFVLYKDLFLTLSAAVGVTEDANDFIFSVALPYRF